VERGATTLQIASEKWGGIGVGLVALESRRLFQISAPVSQIVVWPPPTTTTTEQQMMGWAGLATGYTQRQEAAMEEEGPLGRSTLATVAQHTTDSSSSKPCPSLTSADEPMLSLWPCPALPCPQKPAHAPQMYMGWAWAWAAYLT